MNHTRPAFRCVPSRSRNYQEYQPGLIKHTSRMPGILVLQIDRC